MKNIGVLFLVEHIDRELDAVTCITEKLQSKFGIASDVRNYYQDFSYVLRRYNPNVVVFPFFYGADHIFPTTYVERWPNVCFVNMAWEQILAKLDVPMIVPRDEIAKNKINHLCWTNQHHDFLRDYGVPTDHLYLTGNPVMKFYENPYKNYFDTRDQLAQKYGLDSKRKWVLFPENYAAAFYSDRQLQHLVSRENADLEYLREARAYCDRSLKLFFAWTKDLDGENDPVLILRPRPAITLDQMVDFMRRTIGTPGKNLRIIKAGTAREWILAADHVISSYSTTLIEAALAGKMIHMFEPEPLVEGLESEWHRFVPSLTERDNYFNAVRQTEIVKTGAAVAEWARARVFPVGDPLDAIAEVISRLHRAVAPRAGASIPDHHRMQAGQILVERISKFSQRRPVLRRFTRGYRFGPYRIADIFGADDIAARVWRWRAALKSETPVTL
jgi:surface carbohydrate biosynthesis protein